MPISVCSFSLLHNKSNSTSPPLSSSPLSEMPFWLQDNWRDFHIVCLQVSSVWREGGTRDGWRIWFTSHLTLNESNLHFLEKHENRKAQPPFKNSHFLDFQCSYSTKWCFKNCVRGNCIRGKCIRENNIQSCIIIRRSCLQKMCTLVTAADKNVSVERNSQ